MQDANTVSTPLCNKTRLDAIPANEKRADIALYQSIVGSLMWAALGTRPDIAYAVAALSRCTTNPYTTHMTAAKRVLRYSKGTSQAKIHSPSRGSESTSAIAGYADSDWANDRGDRKSQGGYVFHAWNGPVSWQPKKQKHIALSTTEAEYIACSEATRESRWLAQLHEDVTGESANPVPIFTDSNGALQDIRTAVSGAQSKHIDIQFHNSRELQATGMVQFSHVSTHENLADIMTKSPYKHKYFAEGMGLHT